MCAIAPERVRQSERAAFKAANSEQAAFKMHDVTANTVKNQSVCLKAFQSMSA